MPENTPGAGPINPCTHIFKIINTLENILGAGSTNLAHPHFPNSKYTGKYSGGWLHKPGAPTFPKFYIYRKIFWSPGFYIPQHQSIIYAYMKLFQNLLVQKIDNRAGPPDIQDAGITLPQMPDIR
jgi:hypothetical protein